MTSQHNAAVAEQIAQQVFGYNQLRPAQHEVLAVVLERQDVLAVMPTGSGKSAIYQIAALRLPGITLVVSPLIALQHDQLEAIAQQGTVKAAALNSTLTKTEREGVFQQLAEGELEFIFLAPEQLRNPDTLSALKACDPSLFVVDEAHCVSEWGHDFRPDYLELSSAIEALGRPVILALTATASPLVRKEILDRLGMENSVVIVKGFDRPNITLNARNFYSEDEKLAQLVDAVVEAQPPGIVYAATRKATEKIASILQQKGVKASAYHAGMSAGDRDTVQQQFMNDDIAVIVATSAFGMGIDKANVRFVFHYHIPGSIDAYYQEIGRAARDGEPAVATLFYHPDDMKLQRFFSGGTKVDEETLSELAELLAEIGEPLTKAELKDHLELSSPKLNSALDALEAADLIEKNSKDAIAIVEDDPDLENAVDWALTHQSRQKQFERSRLHMMRGYAEAQSCRRTYLLSYFGEEIDAGKPVNCEGCDNCQRLEPSAAKEIAYLHPFPIGSRIIHTKFGIGQVLRYEEDKVSVLFETVGYKDFVTEVIEHAVRCLTQ